MLSCGRPSLLSRATRRFKPVTSVVVSSKAIMSGTMENPRSCRVTIRFSKNDIIKPEHDMMVSRELITRYSKFFRAAFEHDCFIEAQQGVVVLPVIEIWNFQRFVDWLYRGAGFRKVAEPIAPYIDRLRLFAKGSKSPENAHKANIHPAYRMYCIYISAWVWADKRQAPEYQNWLMERLIDGIEGGAHAVLHHVLMVDFVYSNTIRGCKIRKLQVDTFVSSYVHPESKIVLMEGTDYYHEYEPAFLEEALLASIRDKNRVPYPRKVYDRSLYMVSTLRRDRSFLAASG